MDTIDFSEFTNASVRPDHDEPLVRLEKLFSDALVFISRIEGQFSDFNRDHARGSNVYLTSDLNSAVINPLWSHAVSAVRTELVKPAHVDVGDVETFILGAIEVEEDAPTHDKIKAFSAEKIRNRFNLEFGDLRESRIRQLREAVAGHLRNYALPGQKWKFWTGELHMGSWNSSGGLRLTYRSENIKRLNDVLRFIVHLGTGEDPLMIAVPEIAFWSDGNENWHDVSKIYQRQKDIAPGISWFRFCSGTGVEIFFTPEVHARFVESFAGIWSKGS